MTQIQNKVRSFLKLAFGLPLTLVSLGFVIKLVFSQTTNLPKLTSFSIPVFLTGILFLLLFFLCRSLVWHQLIKGSVTKPISPIDTVYFLSLGELRRYIPGSLVAFVSRGVYFKSHGIGTKLLSRLLILEALLFASSACVLSIPAILFYKNSISVFFEYTFLFAALVGIALITIAIVVYAFKKNKLSTLKGPELGALPGAFILSLVGWLFFGYGNFLVVSSFIRLDLFHALPLISLFIFSWLVGYVSFITPMGLGIREGTLTFLLAQNIGSGNASFAAIWSRIILIFSELLFLLVVAIVKRTNTLSRFTKPWQEYAILFASVLYGIYFSLITLAKYDRFLTGKYDLGNMAHVLYHTSRGNIFMHTDPGGVSLVSRLATHADFILIPLSPFTYLFDPSKFLLVVQSLALGIGGYIVYKLSELILKNKTLALLFGVSYLLNFWVQKQNLFDFHPVTFATPLLLAVFYFIYKKKMIHTVIFLTIAVLTKEQMYLVSFLIGVYLFLKKKRKISVLVMIFSILSFYLLMNVFIPQARTGGHFALSYFDEFGTSPTQIILNMILKPQLLFMTLLTPDRIDYVKLHLLPLGFLPLLSPLYLIGAAPDFLINLVSNNSNLRDINYHYGAVIIPFVYLSGIATVSGLIKKRIPIPVLFAYLLLFTGISSYSHGVLPGSKSPSVEMLRPLTSSEKELETFLTTIPQRLSVSASNNLGSHLVTRDDLFVYPVGETTAQVLVISKVDNNASPNLASHLESIDRLKLNPRYHLIFDNSIAAAFVRRTLIAK